jgi:hypothetical protein
MTASLLDYKVPDESGLVCSRCNGFNLMRRWLHDGVLATVSRWSR